jgi:hypothetical protein
MSTDCCRRQFLQSAGLGIGWLAALDLLHAQANPMAPRRPHWNTKVKAVISLFMQGGPSQVDTFDPKPLLTKLHGQHPPESFGNVDFQNGKFRDTVILGSKRKFQRHGQSGLEVSDLFPHTAPLVDELAVIRSCYHDGFTHSQAQFLINSGWPRIGRPSLGSWILYGLGTENQNLPGFVVLLEGGVRSGPAVYGQGFLPTAFQGTSFRPGKNPILNLTPPPGMKAEDQRDLLDTLRGMNQRHMEERNGDSELSARIAAYELAFRMQMAAPEATDISSESEATRKLYGFDNPDPVGADFASRCLLARRLVERGVRFVQVWSGNGMNATDWDGHIACDQNHVAKARQTDQAVAGLLKDLKSRGLLESTLVIWGGEFGRSPVSDGGAGGAEGRDHNPYGFTIWMAGGGIRGGQAIGATDELGLRAVEDKVHLHDLHATILGLTGLDHTKLTFPYLGRNFRLTDVGGDTALMRKLLRS